VCVGIPAEIPEQPHGGAIFEWFRDAATMARFDHWSKTSGRTGPGSFVHDAAGPVLLVDEAVVRGADWLERRWHEGAPKFKHIAIARRAEGLSAAEFSAAWRTHAGSIGRPGTAGALRIPDDARGEAYVQNHPLVRDSGEWAYDACNEVYFDDLDGLRRRIEWFERSLVGGVGADLVKENWFLAVREEVVIAGANGPND
jgi:hypothetical protein